MAYEQKQNALDQQGEILKGKGSAAIAPTAAGRQLLIVVGSATYRKPPHAAQARFGFFSLPPTYLPLYGIHMDETLQFAHQQDVQFEPSVAPEREQRNLHRLCSFADHGPNVLAPACAPSKLQLCGGTHGTVRRSQQRSLSGWTKERCPNLLA